METKYEKYLEVPSFEDCVRITQECSTFSHSKQEINDELIHSFKYNFNDKDMWNGKYRLNLRGITFDSKGNLLALPFLKFFNPGENESTKDLDFKEFKCAFNKIDGYLISFFRLHNKLELKTMKSVNSEVAIQCREYAKQRPDISCFCNGLLTRNLSPIFEYITPTNRIVIEYEQEDLVFLGARNMSTGEILFPNELDIPNTITKPFMFSDIEQVQKHATLDDVEGAVVVFKHGFMLKIKGETYCKIHKIIDGFSIKKIVDGIIDNTYDDMVGIVYSNNLINDYNKCKDVHERFMSEFKEVINLVNNFVEQHKDKTRKEIA